MSATENTIGGAATTTTAPLPVANTIDSTQDLIPIYTHSSGATQAISRNTYLGLVSAPVGLTDSQTIQNKIIDKTNNFILDLNGNVTFFSSSSNKIIYLDIDNATNGTTFYFPAITSTDTLVTLAATQTLIAKTLTQPIINQPTITNATISADAITGYTTSSNGTIYGIAITGGTITGTSTVNGSALTTGTVGSGALATNAVQANQIATNAITLGYTQITADFTTSATTPTQVTGLTVTVTIPAGGRKIKITAYTYFLKNSTSASESIAGIWDGSVGTGTQLQTAAFFASANGFGCPATLVAIVTPSAGSKTYNVAVSTPSATSATFSALSTAPAFILVEAI